MRGQASERMTKSLGSLSSRCPSVEKLVITISFYSAQQVLLDQKTRTFESEDTCDFVFPCAGECGTGAFNFNASIDQLTAAEQPSVEIAAKCQDRLYTGPRSVCGCDMKCKIEATYLPAEQP